MPMANSSSSSLPADSLTMSSNFRAAHCLTDGQLTPPESPDLPHTAIQRHGPRLQLSKLLRRAKTDTQNPQMALRRLSPARPYVSEMKAPFPLVLPDSPIDSDACSVFSTSMDPSLGLRRRSPTYHDLRSLAARQKDQASRRVESPLLPSPMIKDNNIQSDSYFTFRNPRRARPTAYRSYEDLHILSCYEDSEDNEAFAVQQQNHESIYTDASLSETFLILEGDDDSRSTSSDEAPVTPVDQIQHTSPYCSDESGWLANETSCLERERRFKSRCVQVVQCPDRHQTDEQNHIMVAERQGKPKLVHISRLSQATSTTSQRSSMIARPQTPPRALEISAFSPYDTPDSPRQFQSIDATPCTVRRRPTESSEDYRFSTISLVPAPLVPRASPSNRSSSTVYSDTLEKLAELSDPFGDSPERISPDKASFNSSDWTVSTNAWPVPLRGTPPEEAAPPPRPRTLDAITILEGRICQLRQSIATISTAVNTFPDDILLLDSPHIRAMRASHINDTTYIDTLGKIFPSAPAVLLSALAAWLIIDLWFERAIITSSSAGKDAELTAEDVLHSHHSPDFWTLPNQPLSPWPLDLPSPSSPPDLQGLSTSSLSYAWDANSALRRIPTKARSLLGISASTALNEQLLRAHEAALIRRMRVLRPPMNVIGQRLIVALRGAWDEDVWRCLRGLVDVMEESPPLQKGLGRGG